MVNTRRLRTGHLWQNRYFSCALSENHLRRAVAYVERNPVRAGIVEQPEQYPWSSAALHLGLVRDRLSMLDPSLGEQWGGAEGWRALLSTPEELQSVRLLRRCTHAGRPFGEDEFVARLEDHFQRRWRRWSFEKSTALAS
jgi:putative transposase